ncbi:MAG: glycosyl hydrolase family 95 catalytic domain-containing protein, partial [Sciscionella sp.]
MMPQPKRRDVLRLGTALGAFTALGGLPRSAVAATVRPAALSLVPAAAATTLWYQSPGSESAVMQQGLPIGNGRLGAMVTGDPASDAYCLTEVSLWTGGANASLGGDGQFPYDTGGNFGSYQSLARAHVNVPAHGVSAVSGYRRTLDLSSGYVSAAYQYGGVTYTREAYASRPDDVVVVRLKQSGGGGYTGSVVLSGTHAETTHADSGTMTASFAGTLANGLTYACVAAVAATGGTLSVSGAQVTFAGCSEVVIVFCGGTNYTPNAAAGYKDTSTNPLNVALGKARAAVAVSGDSLLATHVADYQALYNALTVNLGTSTAAQRAMDTPSRLAARAASGASPDPELEASYLQFGRYLAITGSRGSLPANLQGVWLDNNNPAWMSDYHTDINLQMNYWLADRAALPSCFGVFADYCLAQLPGWSATTQSLFQDPRNGFRNSSGRVAGWTTAISANVWGGGGWWWHPASSAWISNTLYDHYLYTLDATYLQKIYPLLKGACQFWEARLITDPGTGLLIDDSDWSPEQGPTNAKGITYAQELVWQLFANYAAAAAALGQDPAYAATISALQAKLYLPKVSPTTGWLEEWMTPDNLGDPAHRHLSPLIGLFPGDRITADRSPAALLAG